MIFGVFLVLVAILLIYWFYVLFKFRSLRDIPGPKPWPLLGNILPSNPYDSLELLDELIKQYKSPMKLWTGPFLHIFLTKPEHFEKVLTCPDNISKSFGYNLFKSWLGEGLVLLTGNKWKIRRKILTSSFHYKILEQYMSIFNETSDVLVKQLEEEVGKSETDIYNFVTLHSLDVICETSMGIKINAQEDNNSEYVKAIVGLLNTIGERFFCIWKHSEFLYKNFAQQGKFYTKFMKINDSFVEKVLKNRKFDPIETEENDEDFGVKKKLSLIDTLMNPENKFDEETILSEVKTFMVGGHDTTASAVAFCLFNLANNEEVQENLYKEIVSIVGTQNVAITTHMLNDLKYLEMVIKESQRRYTTVPTIERTLDKKLEIDGVEYPKGTIISLFIYGMHLDPDLYPEPLKFDPLRFTAENIAKRHKFAYVPFSAGPRNCIGQKFAMFEMKTVLVKILQNYKLKPVPGHELRIGFTGVIKCGNGIKVRIEKRQI